MTAVHTHLRKPECFRAALRALAGVALYAGAKGLVRGGREVPDPGPVTASLDSEYRFYAAWYPIVGAALLAAAREPTVDRRVIRGAAGGVALAAAGRLLSWRQLGRPHRSQLVLLAGEVVLAAGLLPWHSRAFPSAMDEDRRERHGRPPGNRP